VEAAQQIVAAFQQDLSRFKLIRGHSRDSPTRTTFVFLVIFCKASLLLFLAELLERGPRFLAFLGMLAR